MARSAGAKTSRKPVQERGQSVAVQTTGGITVVGAYFTVKLSAGPEQETSPDWQQSSDESCLAADLIATSGGAPADTRGPYLLARFPNVQSAALAARRLQWASQGFSDTIDHPADFCIWLQSGEESKGEIDERSAWQVFEEAPPGQILLSAAAARALETVPAFVLEPGAHGDLCGLKWRAPDDRTNRKADDADIARLIALYNRSESSPESIEQANSVAGQGLGSGDTLTGSGLKPALNRKTIFWGGGVAAAAILAVAAGILLNHKAPASTEAQEPKQSLPITNTDPGPKTTPAVNTNQGANPAPGTTTPLQNPGSDQPASVSGGKHPKPPKPTPPPKIETPAAAEVVENKPRSGCDIPIDEIPTLISQAENLAGRGKYREAEHKFNAVTACEPSNARAREGLIQVRAAIAADKDK